MKKYMIVLLINCLLPNHAKAKNPMIYAKSCIHSAESIFIAGGWSFAAYLGLKYSYGLFTENLATHYKFDPLRNFGIPMIYALLSFWFMEKAIDNLGHAVNVFTENDVSDKTPAYPLAIPYPNTLVNESEASPSPTDPSHY